MQKSRTKKYRMEKNIDRRTDNRMVFKKEILSNGIRVISEEVPNVESFALGIFINAGSREDLIHPGIAHFLEHAAFRHTRSRTSKQIASQFESIGAYTNAFTTKEYTCFYVRALKKNFRKSLELLIDVCLNPALAERDIEKERPILIEEIKSYDDDAEDQIFDLADGMIFPGHPLGNTITGDKHSVSKISQADIVDFKNSHYHPENIVIAFAGNLPHSKIINIAERFTGDIDVSSNGYRRNKPDFVEPSKLGIAKPIQQSHFLLGKRIGGIDDGERYPLALINVLFGDGMSSRLYQTLREKNGLAYNIYSSIHLYSDCGTFYIYAGFDKAKKAKIERLIYREIEKLGDMKLTKVEIARAKEQLKSGTIMEMEGLTERMASLAKSEFYLGKREEVSEILAKIDAISNDDLNDIISKYFTSEGWTEVSIMPE